MVCDLDHFKRVNDTWGHDTGDRVIEAFAGILQSAAPQRATASRFGGEEFVVFLPGANLLGARLFAESVRSAFEALPIAGMDETIRFTASFGVAECRPQEGLSDLRRRADAALYEAKKSGRNRVCISGHGGDDDMPEHPLAAPAAKKMPARSRDLAG